MRFHFKDLFSKQRLLNNWGLKLTSFVIAIALWLIVVNITDPINPRTYDNVKVQIINENVIKDNGKTYEVLAGTDTVESVTIRAPRSTLRELGTNSDAIVAIADMSNLSLDQTTVPIKFSTVKDNDKIDRIRPSSEVLSVRIENRRSVQLPITATVSGEIEKGYIVGDVTTAINQVRISGPESVVTRIKKAVVDVQISGFTDNIATSSDILLYDEEDEPISKHNLQLNVDDVRVNVEILATKKVPVFYATTGEPQQGYATTGEITCEPEVVIIAGPDTIIDSVENINIPAEEINVTGQTGNLTTSIDLKEFLPKGTRFADSSFAGKVNLTVYIESLVTDSYGVLLRNVSIEGIPDGYKAEFAEKEENIEFELVGLAQNLEKMSLSTLNYRVDFGDYSMVNKIDEFKEGIYELGLVMDLPEGVEIVAPVKIKVKLSEQTR